MTLASIESPLLVKSQAAPPAELLLTLRALVAHEVGVKEFFLRFGAENKSVEWLRDMVAAPLYAWVDNTWEFPQVVEACQYLADEYNQLPSEGFFMVNTETGKVDAVFSESDLIDPGFLPREDGRVGQALRKIRPDKEVALVSYRHDTSHTAHVLQELLRRHPQTQLQREEGDPRFRMASRSGRREIAKDLSEDDPRQLLARAGGTAGAFLAHFPLLDFVDSPPENCVRLKGTAACRSQIGVQDSLTLNIQYNRLGSLRASAAQGWIRSICATFSKWAHDTVGAMPLDLEDIRASDLIKSQLWLASPDTLVAFKTISPKTLIAPIEGIRPVGLSGLVGWLEVNPKFSVESLERFQRWEVVASVEYTLHISTPYSGIQTLFPLGVPEHVASEVIY